MNKLKRLQLGAIDSLGYDQVPLNPFPVCVWVGNDSPEEVIRTLYPGTSVLTFGQGAAFHRSLIRSKRMTLAPVDVSSVNTSRELALEVKRALGYPEWAGTKWAAMYDLLQDLDWFQRSRIVVWFDGFDALALRHPWIAAKLVKVVSYLTQGCEDHYPETHPKRIVFQMSDRFEVEVTQRLRNYGIRVE